MNVYGKVRGLESWNIVGFTTDENKDSLDLSQYAIGDHIFVQGSGNIRSAIYQVTVNEEFERELTLLCNLLLDIGTVSINSQGVTGNSGTITIDGTNGYAVVLNLESLADANALTNAILNAGDDVIGAIFAEQIDKGESKIYFVGHEGNGLGIKGQGIVSVDTVGPNPKIANTITISSVWGEF